MQWPVGLGGKGNEGVSAMASRTAGGIGYVEYAYALQNKMTHTKLVNTTALHWSPVSTCFRTPPPTRTGRRNRLLPDSDQPAWQKNVADHRRDLHPDAQKAGQPGAGKEVLAFFAWAYKNGAHGGNAGIRPDAANAVAIFEDSWKKIVGPDGKPVWDGHSSYLITARRWGARRRSPPFLRGSTATRRRRNVTAETAGVRVSGRAGALVQLATASFAR